MIVIEDYPPSDKPIHHFYADENVDNGLYIRHGKWRRDDNLISANEYENIFVITNIWFGHFSEYQTACRKSSAKRLHDSIMSGPFGKLFAELRGIKE